MLGKISPKNGCHYFLFQVSGAGVPFTKKELGSIRNFMCTKKRKLEISFIESHIKTTASHTSILIPSHSWSCWLPMQAEPSELAWNGYLYHIESWSRLRRQDYLFEIPSRYLASCRVIKTSYKSGSDSRHVHSIVVPLNYSDITLVSYSFTTETNS